MTAKRPIIAAVAGLILLSAAGASRAQTSSTATGNLRVQATILSQCAVQDSTLDFGQITPNAPAQPPQADIRITCTAGVPFTVGLDDGQNASAGQRRMLREGSSGSGAGDYLSYELYKDAALANRWGDAVVSERVSATATGATQSTPVFGKVVATSAPSAGNFVDNAVITLHF